MALSSRNIIFIIVVLLLMFGTYKLTTHLNEKKVEKLQVEIKRQKIKNDTLVKIRDGFYTKLVADTLTKQQLKQKIDSLQLEVENPKVIEVIKFVPKEVTKPIDDIDIQDSTLYVSDYYPQKENYFVNYSSEINLITGVGEATFKFSPIELSLGIGQKEDGTFEVKTKVPDFIEIASIDVETQPIKTEKKDNFGLLIGAGYGRNFNDKTSYLNLSTGIRYKKVYLTINAGSNNTANTTLTFEF